MARQFPYIVILEDVRSALNVGAIFRTCDGAGVEKLYLTGITPYPPHNRIPKTALGAEEFVQWEKVKDISVLISELRASGFKLYAVEQAAGSTSYIDMQTHDKTALIFGNEVSGVSAETLAAVDGVIEIPMFGQKNSLNIATTVGIICYHMAGLFSKKD